MKHDKDQSGYLSRKEARDFAKTTLSELQGGKKYNEDSFSRMFTEVDKNKSGNLSKREVKILLKKLVE